MEFIRKNKQYVQINISSFFLNKKKHHNILLSFDVKCSSYVPSLAINILFFTAKVLKQKLKLIINIAVIKKIEVILNRHVVMYCVHVFSIPQKKYLKIHLDINSRNKKKCYQVQYSTLCYSF